MTETGQGKVDRRVLASLLVLNIAVHFIPFARPGFQPDDFMLLHQARATSLRNFIDLSLSEATRPLGRVLYILIPYAAGLTEPYQLLILVSTTALLTALVYLLLVRLFLPPVANLAALAFVVWPVKHEIYSSQLFGVINLAGILIVGSAMLYRRWTQVSRSAALALALLCYGLSIFIYEIGYLAPLVFYLAEPRERREARGLAFFLIPAVSYWVFRLTHEAVSSVGGTYPVSMGTLGANLLTSLPSNLVGFQLARNVGYGLWAVISGPSWFHLWCAATALAVGLSSTGWIVEAQRRRETNARWQTRAGGGLLSAALLAAPAATILVESRHSILAAVGMGVAISALAARLKPLAGTAAILVLLLATQGLALRQAEVSRLQSAVYHVVANRREEIRSASSIVFDFSSLLDRVSYTWGNRKANVLNAYWGIPAFTASGLAFMVEDALYRGTATPVPSVRTCVDGLAVLETTVTCQRDYGDGAPFQIARAGALVVDFKTVPLLVGARRNFRYDEASRVRLPD